MDSAELISEPQAGKSYEKSDEVKSSRFPSDRALHVIYGLGLAASISIWFIAIRAPLWVDVSPEALALAAQRVPGASLRELDVQCENLKERFDLVMAIQVIEHLADDTAALRNMALMAKHWVLVTTIRGRMRKSELAIGHFRNYSDVELRAKAESAGLEVVDIFGWGFPFYSPLYRTMIEWLPGGPPEGKFGTPQRAIASFLYHLYALNIPLRGDVVTMLARPKESTR